MYARTFDNSALQNYRVIDLRSDTFSIPPPEMKVAMVEAEVGDDVYGEDPTVVKFEQRCAEMFGKKAGLFTVSGTMSNLLATMVHCNQRGAEVIIGDKSHFFKFEQGCYATIAGVSIDKVKNLPDGTLDLNGVRESIRGNDVHEPITRMIMIENTQNMMGGKVLPLKFLDEISKICKENNLKLHMDGSRIFNAATYLKEPVSRIARDVDSVCFCLSKSLCCPVGSILMGTKEFIEQARRLRKAVGGGMRQVGILAAAGLYGLDNMISKLEQDHVHARILGEAIQAAKNEYFNVDLDSLQTNIMTINAPDPEEKITALALSDRLIQVTEQEIQDGITDSTGKGIIIKSCCWNLQQLKIVFYPQITEEMTQLAIKKILYAMNDLKLKR